MCSASEEKNLPFALFRVMGVWRKSWNLEAETIQELWDGLVQLHCWIVELFQPQWQNVCSLTYAKIKFWTVRNAASCCYCHLTEYCCLLGKKGILGSPRARFNLFCWQNMLRQAFLNNNIFMEFLEVGGVGERICPEWFFSSVAHTSFSKQRNV